MKDRTASRRILQAVFLTLLILAAAAMLAGCGSSDTGEAEENPGNLKSFSVKTLDGKTLTEKDLEKYDLTVINFWSTGCQPCTEEMPELDKLRIRLPGNVQLLLVSLEPEEMTSYVKDTVKDAGYRGTVAMLPEGDMAAITSEIQYIPYTLFFDSSGQAVGSPLTGSPKDVISTYRDAIDNALKEASGEAGQWND